MPKYELVFNGHCSYDEMNIDVVTGPYEYWVEAVDLTEAEDIAEACLGVQIYSHEALSIVRSVIEIDNDKPTGCSSLVACLSWGMAEVDFIRNEHKRICRVRIRPYTPEEIEQKTLLRMRRVLV